MFPAERLSWSAAVYRMLAGSRMPCASDRTIARSRLFGVLLAGQVHPYAISWRRNRPARLRLFAVARHRSRSTAVEYEHTSFMFLRFEYRARVKNGRVLTWFLPAASTDALEEMSATVR
jgi:hypothetical protein